MMEGLRCIKGVCAKKKLAMIAEHVRAIMEIRRPPGMSMENWALTKAVVMVGWMAFLRVSEMVGRLWNGERKAEGGAIRVGCV